MEASNARNHPDKSRQELEAELARKQEALLQTNLVADGILIHICIYIIIYIYISCL